MSNITKMMIILTTGIGLTIPRSTNGVEKVEEVPLPDVTITTDFDEIEVIYYPPQDGD